MIKFLAKLTFISILFIIVGCTQKPLPRQGEYAPVIDLPAERAKARGYYEVRLGETLYFIAWRFDMDYEQLAEINDLSAPYKIIPGERLYLSSTKIKSTTQKPVVSKTVARRSQTNKTSRTSSAVKSTTATKRVKQVRRLPGIISHWQWPVRGHVLDKFSATNKGINIAGQLNQLVKAAAAGEVVYSGEGLASYGKLIIIKHNNEFLTAYAHNERLLVHEGQWVTAGQIIARMGHTGTIRVMLHFEMRRYGKPVNPLGYLPVKLAT